MGIFQLAPTMLLFFWFVQFYMTIDILSWGMKKVPAMAM